MAFPFITERKVIGAFCGIVPPNLVDQQDLTFEDIRPEVERYSGMRVTETFWLSTYNAHHRVAHAFQCGRVFLLGDAGHIHSPAGGQGMNTGLMDATNLGWKLAAVLKGDADERLLASYEPERLPFAHLLVNTTDRVFTAVSTSSPWVRLLRSVVVPTMFTTIARLPQVRRAFFGLISQTRINYHDSPLSRGSAGRVRAGDRLPWVRYPMTLRQGLVSPLHHNSDTRRAALASPCDTSESEDSGHSDKVPVPSQSCRKRSVMID